MRQEIIFDSNALTCTVFVVHILNLCRSRIAHIDPPLLIQNNATLTQMAIEAEVPSSLFCPLVLCTPENNTRKRQVYIWHHYAANIVYAIVSILLLLDIDIGSKLALATEQDEHNVPTIVMHCILIGSILQMPVTKVNYLPVCISFHSKKKSI